MTATQAIRASSLDRPPKRRGAERSRRRNGLTDPVLFSFVTLGSLLGLIIGVTLYLRVAMDDMRMRDAQHLGETAYAVSMETDRLFLDAALLANDIAAKARMAFDTSESPPLSRVARRELTERLLSTPFSGLALENHDGSLAGHVQTDSKADISTAYLSSALSWKTELLSDRVHLLATNDTSFFLFVPLDHQTLILTLPAKRLMQILSGDDYDTYLARPDGSVVSHSANSPPLRHIDSPASWLEPTQLRDSTTMTMTFAGHDHTVAAHTLSGRELVVHVVGLRHSLQRLLKERGLLFLSLFGPAALALTLVISIIQNEWARRDRRANTSADVVARADIACDILNAGIIDWSTADARVSYSRGWRDLMDPEGREETLNEEIFDWIDRIHDEDRAMIRAGYQCLLDGEEEFLRQSFRVRRSDGVYIQIMEQAVARTDVDGRARRVVMVQTQM